MSSQDVSNFVKDVDHSAPLRFEEAWASIMSNPIKRAWAFNHHIPTAEELLRARDNMPFSKNIFLEAPSKSSDFMTDAYRLRMEDLFCTCYKLRDGTSLGFVLNSACGDFSLPVFSAFEPNFVDLQLAVCRLIVGAVQGRLFVMEFCWLKSGAFTARFGPYRLLHNSEKNELRCTHTVYAFLPSDAPILSAFALCPGEPNEDFIHARFENILVSADWYTLDVVDTCFQSACIFCSARGATVCGCPLPMRRRSGYESDMISYKVREGKSLWEEFGVVKSTCARRGTVVFNVTKATNSRFAKVLDSGIIPYDYTIQLNVATSASMQLHLTITGQSAVATRTVLTPFSLKNTSKRQIQSPQSSVQDFAAHGLVVSSTDSNKKSSPFCNSSSNNELVSLITGVRKRARVGTSRQYNNQRNTNNNDEFAAHDIDAVIDATSSIVESSPALIMTETLSLSNGNTSKSGGINNGRPNQDQQQSKVYPCPECGAQIKNKMYNLKRHIQVVHQKERKFGCTIPNCGQRFQTKTNLKRHLATVHKGQSMAQNQQQQEKEQYRQQQHETLQQSMHNGMPNCNPD